MSKPSFRRSRTSRGMSERVPPPQQRWRRTFTQRAALAGLTALFAIVLVAPAAAKVPPAPLAGTCWGTCGGDSGPVGGYFILGKRHKHHSTTYRVRDFTVSESCLGTEVFGTDALPLFGVPVMRVKLGLDESHYKFSYSGTAKRATNPPGSATVQVNLQGTFVSSTKAHISLQIDYGQCTTDNFTVVRHG
jgi:hypothetical protein